MRYFQRGIRLASNVLRFLVREENNERLNMESNVQMSLWRLLRLKNGWNLELGADVW